MDLNSSFQIIPYSAIMRGTGTSFQFEGSVFGKKPKPGSIRLARFSQ
jgi:hypothetical protein